MLVEPDELPLPIEPLEPVEPELGDVLLGDVVLGDELLLEPVELPLELDGLLVLPLELDLLKWASHSEREIVPSLLVSTDEKLGCEALPELDVLGELELEDEPPAAPVDFEDESAAMASDDSANSAAAVVTVTVFSI